MTQEFYWLLATIMLTVLSAALVTFGEEIKVDSLTDRILKRSFYTFLCLTVIISLYIIVRYGLTLPCYFTPLLYQNN